MRKPVIAPGEIYHILNRGTDLKPIFLDERDFVRFLYLVLHAQSSLPLNNTVRSVAHYALSRQFSRRASRVNEIVAKRVVTLIGFCLMPNHFHLIVREEKEGGMANYLHRIQNAYVKYFNTKYRRTGHLFQGAYKAVRVESNTQLLHLSAYVHKNPRGLKEWRAALPDYPYGSFTDYIKENRFGDLLDTEIISSQFKNKKVDYRKFVDSSTAKERDKNLGAIHLI
ncbi:MAG: hypothetical protein UX94_C0004G0051 [Parcubacteria group bacterium GW2011_GWA2_47_21]|nr:MAG: hypothetical protein UX94_C0004G0051 [Parcubacteria group bacterium GW2011_GWA2_47_21]